MIFIDYKKFAEKNILNTEIRINGKKDVISYHKYKSNFGLDLTDENINVYAINVLTKKWKKKPFETIKYTDIDKVKISICRRNYSMIASIIVNEYHLDITTYLKNGFSYQFETQYWNSFVEMINKFSSKEVRIIDPIDIYNNYLNIGKRYLEKLDRQYDELIFIHNLESYRGDYKR